MLIPIILISAVITIAIIIKIHPHVDKIHAYVDKVNKEVDEMDVDERW